MWSQSCAAPVTDQVELTVSRPLALASTGCGASCVLERHSVSWCLGEGWEDGLINHHFPQTGHLSQDSRGREISASSYFQPLFFLFIWLSCSSSATAKVFPLAYLLYLTENHLIHFFLNLLAPWINLQSENWANRLVCNRSLKVLLQCCSKILWPRQIYGSSSNEVSQTAYFLRLFSTPISVLSSSRLSF